MNTRGMNAEVDRSQIMADLGLRLVVKSPKALTPSLTDRVVDKGFRAGRHLARNPRAAVSGS
jgi:hypothetical protein